jgi:hypothetical protein
MARLVVRRLECGEAHRLLHWVAGFAALTPAQWDAVWENHNLIAFAAGEGDSPRALVLAEDHAQLVHMAHLEGRADACRLLLDRLVLLAGERDMSALVPVARTEVHALLEESGFVRVGEEDRGGGRCYVYLWNRSPSDGEGA